MDQIAAAVPRLTYQVACGAIANDVTAGWA
jgi:hypothetical protein